MNRQRLLAEVIDEIRTYLESESGRVELESGGMDAELDAASATPKITADSMLTEDLGITEWDFGNLLRLLAEKSSDTVRDDFSLTEGMTVDNLVDLLNRR